MKTHQDAERERVKVVVVRVYLHCKKGAHNVDGFDVIVLRSKRLRAWQDFVDAFTEVNEVCMILGSVVHRLIPPF